MDLVPGPGGFRRAELVRLITQCLHGLGYANATAQR
jgi:hypothetical protein